MAFIIGCVPIVLTAAAAARAFHRRFALTLPASTLGSILILYLFGLLGALSAGVYAVYALGLSAAAVLVISARRDRAGNAKKASVPTPAFVMTLLAVPVIWFVSRGRLMLIWDEFSHWGTVVKNMYLFDAFGSVPASTAIYKSYPPSIGLLQYYFMHLEPVFSEATLYRAKDFLTLSLLLPFFQETTWKDYRALLLLAVIVFCMPLIDYYYFYRSIHVDGLMALLFLYILIAYDGARGGDVFDASCIALGIFSLAMIKSSGTGFCILILVLLLIDFLARKSGTGSLRQNLSKREAPVFLLPTGVLLFAAFSWRISLSAYGAADYWNASAALSPDRMLEGLTHMQLYQKETLERFFSAMFALRDDTYAIRMSPLSWIFVVVVPMVCAFLTEREDAEKKRIRRMGVLLLAGYAVWLLVLLVMFLFVFADFEALNLDGLERYTSTYQLGAMGYAVYTMIGAWRRNRKSACTAYLCLLLCAELFLFTFSDMAKATVLSPSYNAYTRAERAAYPKAPDLSSLNPQTDRVCFIGQQSESTGLAFYYIRYLETPVYVGMLGSWSIGEKYGESDDWTVPFTCAQWQKALYESDYTHLYLHAVDEPFIEQFGAAFARASDIHDGALLTLERTGGSLRLVPAA